MTKPSILKFREYQFPVWNDRHTGILILHWARQIGKSFTLAAWAVDRLLVSPGRLVTVLSNSRENGAEFVAKCADVCNQLGTAFEQVDDSPDTTWENMRMEVRITRNGKVGRIKVLAANPRTARGFSGDLILDEFAFHEDSAAIWEAAEPILASKPDYLCRIASTGNGKYNLFYRMASGAANSEPRQPLSGSDSFCTSAAGFKVSRVSRTLAHALGVQVYDAHTRKPITPEQARAAALDKRAYDQNYECSFDGENMTLLTHELISAAERDDVGFICEQEWSAAALALFRRAQGPLFVGVDVGRNRDLTVMTVVEELSEFKLIRGILRLQGMRLPEQQLRLGELCRLQMFRCAAIDMTGIGLGLTEYSQNAFGRYQIRGINFAQSVPISPQMRRDGRPGEMVRITEAMATTLLQAYEGRRIQQPRDVQLRDDLRKPEKVTSPGGRVSIAATRTEAGHADHFWSLALALEANGVNPAPFGIDFTWPDGRGPRPRYKGAIG